MKNDGLGISINFVECRSGPNEIVGGTGTKIAGRKHAGYKRAGYQRAGYKCTSHV